MTVKEFLETFGSIIKMNSFFWSNVPKTLVVDIEQDNLFHAVGYFKQSDFGCHPELTIQRPFERTLYQKSKEASYSVLDMKVSIWKLIEDDNNLVLRIDTEIIR